MNNTNIPTGALREERHTERLSLKLRDLRQSLRYRLQEAELIASRLLGEPSPAPIEGLESGPINEEAFTILGMDEIIADMFDLNARLDEALSKLDTI